ncbi:MAG TPA: PfkB family carbohydrate kinase [Thermoanaerobaculia bacterium]|nr:PfkB family carbohydrate kinase [Thermoanaerobaculia bacterium]
MAVVFDVLLFGEALVDEFPSVRALGGAPFNVACHLRALGASPLFVTRVGRDADGRRLVDAMKRRGVDTRGVQRDPGHRTARAVIRAEPAGPAFVIPDRQAFDFIDGAAALDAVRGVTPRLVYFGTLAQRHDVSREALDALLDEVSGTRFLDVNLRSPWFDRDVLERSLGRSAFVKMNEGEAAEIAGLFGLPAHGRSFRGALSSRFGLTGLVVTSGEDGAIYRGQDGVESRVTPLRSGRRVVDTVGAGDAFAAVQILGRLRRWDTGASLARADAFARAICGLRGALPRRSSFYARFLREWGREIAA